MSQIRGTTTTNQLNSVIQVLQMGKKTGILSVEREGERGIEVGTMVFIHGQITEARIQGFQGQNALAILSIWGACRFHFSVEAVEQSRQNISSVRQILQNVQTTPGVHSGQSMQSRPAMGGGRITSEHQSMPGKQPVEQRFSDASVVPQRVGQLERVLKRVESEGLSRVHRRLLLLLDGQRGISELASLLNRREEEVIQLLRDLAQRGFIS